nr:AraC family transcriptional regulator [uncultured Desulfobacter sp.]
MKAAYTTFDFTGETGPRPVSQSLSNGRSSKRRELVIRPGVILSLMDFVPETAESIRYQKDSPMINFGFIVQGGLINRICSPYGTDKVYHNKKGIAGIHFRSQRNGQILIPTQKRLQVVHVHLSPLALNQLFERDSQDLPYGFRQLMDSPLSGQYDQKTTMTPQIFEVAHHILRGPGEAMPATLFYESKVLELLCLQTGSMGAAGRTGPGLRYRFSKTDLERIHEVERLIGAGMDTWPVIADLASAVGMGTSKLKAGFSHVYGMPVSAMVKEKKMKQAKALLQGGGMNVSQTAWALGYTNVSHFCAAFKKRFGILPGAFLKDFSKPG